MPGIEDKLMTASQIKEVTDTKLDKDFSSLDTSGGFSLTDELAVNISGSPYRITGRTLANAIGGGGTEQAALTNYVKNCGTISSLPATFTDSNITADMIIIEYTVGDESAVGSDWTVTTSDGSFTIAGTLAKSTSLTIVFGVGYSTTPSILTNLASDSPDNILKASPRPGVTGVLPLVNGGVGSSTAAGARTNLDVYSKSETNSAIQQSTASDWGSVGSWMSDAERGSCGMAYFGKVLTVSFMTNSRVHAEGDVIMTLPEPWHPRFNVDIPAFYRNGCCVLRINTSGVMTIWILNDTTNAGRIYGNFTLVVP